MHRTANARMIEPRPQGAQAGFDIAQALAIGELSKGHAQELVPAGKTADFVVALIALDATAKLVRGNEIQQLREHRLAKMHGPHPPRMRGQHGCKSQRNSNRKRLLLGVNSLAIVSYTEIPIQ